MKNANSPLRQSLNNFFPFPQHCLAGGPAAKQKPVLSGVPNFSILEKKKYLTSKQWAIPENIHTPPWTTLEIR